jgi:hypothetical protein
MTWPHSATRNQYGPYSSQDNYVAGSHPPAPESDALVHDVASAVPATDSKHGNLAVTKVPPAKNFPEFKPAAPQTSSLPVTQRPKTNVSAPNKTFENEPNYSANVPNGSRWGRTVGMNTGE